MPVLYFITARKQLVPSPGKTPEELLQEKVRAAFAAGIDYVQVREKDLPDGRLARLVEGLARCPEKQGARLLVNERLDIASSCGADGVHLPSDSLPVAALRAAGGRKLVVGVSCHNEKDVARAAGDGAAYVLLGPVFETPSKPGAKPFGLAALADICRRFAVPVIALGGIHANNAGDCIRAGAAGVAGIRLFQQAADLRQLCRHLRSLETS